MRRVAFLLGGLGALGFVSSATVSATPLMGCSKGSIEVIASPEGRYVATFERIAVPAGRYVTASSGLSRVGSPEGRYVSIENSLPSILDASLQVPTTSSPGRLSA